MANFRSGSGWTTALAAKANADDQLVVADTRSLSLTQKHPQSTSTTVALQTVSPLERFKLAKERISGLFHNLNRMMDDVVSRIFRQAETEGTSDDLRVVVQKAGEDVGTHQLRLSNASEKVKNNQMKVAFFGRTSNGKSSVINAMLGNRILPVGIGHTTSCFCCVQGTSETSAFLEMPGSNTRKDVETVQQLAHSLHNDKLENSALVKVFWPHQQCSLLKNDVVILDSPGIDISPDLDSWIDKHCKDADVFVLVANAESTLMHTEKSFFHKLAEMSSKPNIFILNNRWDASAAEPEFMDEVRQQHLDRNLEFLCNELKVVNRQEGQNRVFFVSAKETLFLRMHQDQSGLESSLAEGFHARLAEFETFEKAFEECISSHAIKTKFGEPARTGLSIASHLHASLDTFQNKVKHLRQQQENELVSCRERTVVLRREAEVCIAGWTRKIQEMRTRSQEQVAKSVTEEIHQLWNIVRQHESSVGFSEGDIDPYKKELCEHISASLGQQLLSSCSQKLSEDCVHVQQNMFDELQRIFPPSLTLPSASSFVRPNFRVSHEMDIANLCSDFMPDLRFRFRWGWSSLMHWLSGGQHGRFSISTVPAIMRRASSTESTDDLESGSSSEVGHTALPFNPDAVQQNMQLAARVAGQAPWLMLGVGVLVWKAVGWQVIAGGLSIYGILYGYERLCWTNRAKERVFKEQMVSFATDKLKVAVAFISSSCSSQVQQQLSSCKEQLCGELNTAQGSLQRQRVLLEHQIAQLMRLEHESHQQANLAKFARTGFNDFLSELGLSSSVDDITLV